ncbi:hypothetical protein Tco_0989452 [Tanacetum coccineum]|uniref:Uncharacterized protein n=1 Tax=Tanacetum coccineum TaxID=301880 RepID=A0ABQ5EU85_9ASTR
MEGVVPSITGESGNAAMEVESPYVVEKIIEKEKLSHVKKDKLSFFDDITVLEPFPQLSTPVSMAGNAPSKSSYANITSKPSGKKVNVRTLFTPGGNRIDVVVLKVAYLVVANYVRNTWGKYGLVRSMFSSSTRLLSFQFSSMDGLDAMLENGPCEDRLSAIATKLGTPLMLDSYTSDMCMQSSGTSSYARFMIKLKADVELKDNIAVAMTKITREGHYTCAGEKKTVKKPKYRPVTKKPNASSSGNKKKGVDPTIECASNTPIGVKIDKIERQIGEGKLKLLDNDGNPLVPRGIVESDSEVELVFDETANLRILTSGKDGSDKGYGTNSLLEQWRDSYPVNDDYDPYDDDMYENHDLSEHLQSICDDLDITVRGRKKK